MYEATPQVVGREDCCCTIAGRGLPSSRSPHVARDATKQNSGRGKRAASACHLEGLSSSAHSAAHEVEPKER